MSCCAAFASAPFDGLKTGATAAADALAYFNQSSFMNKLILAAMVSAAYLPATSQDVSGKVTDHHTGRSLPGASVYWASTTIGTTTNSDGAFTLPFGESPLLVVSMVGYKADSIPVYAPVTDLRIALMPTIEMETVEISEKQLVFSQSASALINTEAISRGVLRKAACCNISETFESTATVDVVMNDAVTGTRKIQMLGLDGIYVQNLLEAVPFTRGLGNILGFDQIPGPWIQSIQLNKGLGSVINGYESMIGQINLDFIQPCSEEKLRFDVFASNQGRYESNLVWNKQMGTSWSTALFVGAHTQQARVDMNRDGFMDMPLRDGLKLMNRWKYEGDLFRAELAASYTREERTAGQTDFRFNEHFGRETLYGFGLDYTQAEVMGKFGIFHPTREDKSLGITTMLTYHDAYSFFANNEYSGLERSARINALYQSKFKPTSHHSYKVGVHGLYDAFRESFADSAFRRTERVPGLFAEYTFARPKFTAVAGSRFDAHNLYGNQFSPRVHLKYNPKQLSTLRFAAGRGFRAPNAFADQLGMLASSRRVHVLENPQAEVSWNAGVSALHKFKIANRDASINTDYFHTWFENQWVVDRDASPQWLLFYNLPGRGTAHSFQTDFQYNILNGLEAKLSYKYQYVETDYLQGTLEKPLIPRHRALTNLSYETKNERWYFDITANYYGTSRLPNTRSNPEGLQIAQRSDDFFILHAQVTWVWKGIELYVGAENIGNFIQSNAIVDAENPFSEFFDASLIYGPLNGRMYYAGARFNLNTAKK